MALEQNLDARTYESDADLSSSQFRFVKLTATGTVEACSVAGEQAVGVLQNDPEANRAANVAVGGRSKVEAGAAVSIDDDVATDASGKAVTATTSDVILGKARSAAGADGEIVSVELTVPYRGTAA